MWSGLSSDCATGSDNGAHCFPNPGHLRVPDGGNQDSHLLHDRAWRTGLKGRRLLREGWGYVRRDEVAEKTQGWVNLVIVIIVIKDVYIQYLIRSVFWVISCIEIWNSWFFFVHIKLGLYMCISNKDCVLVSKLNCWPLTEYNHTNTNL